MEGTDCNGSSNRDRPLSRWFWSGFLVFVLLGVLVTLFAAMRAGKEWAEANLARSPLPPTWTEVIRVTLSGGETAYLATSAVPELRAAARERLDATARDAEATLLVALNGGLDRTFEQVWRQIPAFADWYYSLQGEYARLFHALAGDVADFLTRKVDELIFGPADTAAAIDELAARMELAMAEQLHGAALEMQSLMVRLIDEHRVPQRPTQLQVTGQWDLGDQLGNGFGPYLTLTPTDIARQGVAGSAGVAASAATTKKLGSLTVAKAAGKIGAKTSMSTLAALASKLGLKSVVKTGGTLGGAGTGAAAGAAVCAGTVVGVPLAPGCALVGGAVTGLAVWLIVDKAAIEADEYLHRDELEDELRQALAMQRAELHAALHTRYVTGTTESFVRLLEQFDRTMQPTAITPPKDFVPARAASRRTH